MLTILHQRPGSHKIFPWESPNQVPETMVPPIHPETVVFVYEGTAAQALQAYMKKDKTNVPT